MNRKILGITTALFAALSLAALRDHGYWGIFEYQFQTLAGWQVLVDLFVSLSLVSTWMSRDAKATSRTFWPWLVLTIVLGSFGPLFYLLSRPTQGTAQPR